VIDVLLMPRVRLGEYGGSSVAGLSQEWKANARPALLCDNNEIRYPSVQINILYNQMIRLCVQRFFTGVRPPASFREETRVSYWEYIPLRPPILHIDILWNTVGADDTYICVLRARHLGAMLMAYGWRQHHDHAWPPKTIQLQFRYSGRNSTVPG
jgi:hypothetical protein